MKSVLIVDDEKSFLLSLQDGLSPHGDNFEVLVAADGREAIDILRSRKIDLLVTDLKLPVLDGFEVLAWVSRHCQKMAVIVMTAFGTPEIESRLARMDSFQYLEKPLDLDMLEQSIFSALSAGSKSYIRGITLATFLQLVRVEQKNCTIKVSCEDRVGYIYLRRGELLDAETGDLQGEGAAYEIFSWEDAEIEMDAICRKQHASIDSTLEHVLMEAFRLKDERNHRIRQKHAQEGVDAESPLPAADQGTLTREPPVSSERVRRQQLLHFLNHSRDVMEYAIFDVKGFLERKSSGKNSMLKIDPEHYLGPLEELGKLFVLGDFSHFCINTKSRTRYLLFSRTRNRVFVRLRPGIRPAEVRKNIQRFVKC